MEIHDKIIELLANYGINWQDNVPLAKSIKELVLSNQISSLKESVFNTSSMKDGKRCPVCNQRVKMMKKAIDSGMTYYLIKLYRINKTNPIKKWFHVTDDIGVSYKIGGRFAKLRFWGLIEEKKKEFCETEKRTSGMWAITDDGIKFIEGVITVPKYAKLYNMGFYGFEGNEVNVHEALSTKFNYSELMSL